MDMTLYALLNKRIKAAASSIQKIEINEAKHLIVTLNNGTVVDAGELPSDYYTKAEIDDLYTPISSDKVRELLDKM